MAKPHRVITSAGAAVLAMLLSTGASPLAAQKSTTRGFNLGVHLQAATLSVEGADPEGGGGMGFRVGYGINRIVTLYVEADGISVTSDNADEFQGTWTLGHADLGARFHFANSLRAWVPYLDVAIGGRGASVDNAQVDGSDAGDLRFNGGSFSFGGGLSAYLSEGFALDVGLKFSSGEFNEIEVGNLSIGNLDIDAESTRFKVGIVWWP